MNDTTHTNGQNKPNIPRVRIWIMAALFLAVGIGMYAGTMYRIQNYGYVGIQNDQPITKDDAQTN